MKTLSYIVGACRFIAAAVGLVLPIACPAQGTTTITFDGLPEQPKNSAYVVQGYSESGFYFVPLQGSSGFVRNGGGQTAGFPYNGSAYLQAGLGDSLAVARQGGSPFSLVSVDLAGYSTVVPNFSVPFVGYYCGGGIIATNFSGSGINFRTVHFGPEFSGLQRVEIPGYAWSLDNLVVSIPEPSVSGLLICGVPALALKRLRTRRKRRNSDSIHGQPGETSVMIHVLPITPPAVPGASLVSVTPYPSVQ